MKSAIFDITDRSARIFIYLLTIHSALLVASNAGGSKIIALPGGLAASATGISYILSFVILDSIAEIYGRDYSRIVINVGLGAVVISVVFLEICIALPPAGFWSHQDAYAEILGAAPRILLGGLTAYLVSQYLDLYSFLTLKATRLGARWLWLRAWVSMAVSQVVDTVIFIAIAFYGTIPLIPAMTGQYLIKMTFATVATPLVYLVVNASRAMLAPAPAGRQK